MSTSPSFPPATSAATAAATSAASGLNGKTRLPSLVTSSSTSYPSEIRTPLSAVSTDLRRHGTFKSPMSPPASYLDFLNKAKSSGGLMSPPDSGGPQSSRFPSVADDNAAVTGFSLFDKGKAVAPAGDDGAVVVAERGAAGPTSHPPMSRHSSTDSSASSWTISSDSTAPSPPATGHPRRRPPPPSPRIQIPSNQYRFPRPNSARTPHSLRVPNSPFSASSVRSPMSARSLQSQYATLAHAQTPYSASAASPRFAATPQNSLPLPVINAMERRQGCRVVRREQYKSSVETTWEILRLDPAPKGKRRKTSSSKGHPQVTPTQGSFNADRRSKSEEIGKSESSSSEEEEEEEEEGNEEHEAADVTRG